MLELLEKHQLLTLKNIQIYLRKELKTILQMTSDLTGVVALEAQKKD